MIRLAWRICAIVVLLLTGLVILFSLNRLLSDAQQRWIRQYWSLALLRICGVRLSVTGALQTDTVTTPSLVVMNHVSWLDIFALNAVMPVTFVAKAEIRRWPLVGWLVSGTRTIFIERGSQHAVRRVNHEIRHRLANGEHIGFFPEGTTSNGQDVLPFHTSLFAAALHQEESPKAAIPVMPVAIRYFQKESPSVIPAYTGEQTLVNSIVQILSHRDLRVELHGLAPVSVVSSFVTRHALAADVEAKIRSVIRQESLRFLDH
jgi:1-acyl-sn-glycerol-3-phosphate acyltransferase